MPTVPTSYDHDADQYRLAQARRLLAYCREIGVDPVEVMEERITVDLSSICDDDGTIVPRPQDVVRRYRVIP